MAWLRCIASSEVHYKVLLYNVFEAFKQIKCGGNGCWRDTYKLVIMLKKFSNSVMTERALSLQWRGSGKKSWCSKHSFDPMTCTISSHTGVCTCMIILTFNQWNSQKYRQHNIHCISKERELRRTFSFIVVTATKPYNNYHAKCNVNSVTEMKHYLCI